MNNPKKLAKLPEYIQFEDVDQICSDDPDWRTQWIGLAADLKQSVFREIHRRIEARPWLGIPLGSPLTSHAFPRLLEIDCRMMVVTWDTDPDSWINHTQLGSIHPESVDIVPASLIARSIIEMLRLSLRRDVRLNRDIGVAEAQAGPVRSELRTGESGQVLPPVETDIPGPLWNALQRYSWEYYKDEPPMATRMIRM